MLGFSLSPGGLLLPYHLGALAALSFHGHLTDQTHLAGSSAGAIAVAAHASGVPPLTALDGSIRISSQSNPLFVARGHIMPCMWNELDALFPKDAHERVNQRPGMVGLAHYELFPENRAVLQTQFETRKCLMDAVCDSSMFPYFTSNRPVRWVKRTGEAMPRMVVDGVFTEPLWRFGCPDLQRKAINTEVTRSVSISVFPKELMPPFSLQHQDDSSIICPKLQMENVVGQVSKLVLMATTKVKPRNLVQLYEGGWSDAERWVVREDQHQRADAKKQKRSSVQASRRKRVVLW